MRKSILIILLALTAAILPAAQVFADPTAAASASPVIGSWMLDSVYENASGTDRFVLAPENAASLYGEKDNIYAFLADGTAEMTMEGETWFGYWEQKDNGLLMVINSTVRNSAENTEDGQDIDPLFEESYFYDEDQGALHRYWKDDAPEAAYHDLDFVYKKIPQGTWMMTKVYSREPGREPLLMDPETSQSLYAESVNRLTIFLNKVVELVPAETAYISETGMLTKSGDHWQLDFDDGFSTELYYDDKTEVMHRYWTDTAADASYLDLDFVYEKLPVRDWRLNSVYEISGDQDPVLLDGDREPELYQETRFTYTFGPFGEASASVPAGSNETAEWTRNDESILLRFDDGREMVFAYDPKAEVLHRYQDVDDPVTGHRILDFVFLNN